MSSIVLSIEVADLNAKLFLLVQEYIRLVNYLKIITQAEFELGDTL